MGAHLSERLLVPTEQNDLRPSSPDPIPVPHPPLLPPRGYEKICLRLCSEDKHFKKEIITWIAHAQL